jgi:hypothetical protein
MEKGKDGETYLDLFPTIETTIEREEDPQRRSPACWKGSRAELPSSS